MLLLAGTARAWSLRWVCDDSFVSFRYAQNLVAGRGLVYNAAERVEGYTNLSWTLLLAGVERLGGDPVAASAPLGLAFHLALAALLAARAWRAGRRTGSPFLPLAAAVVLVLPDAQVWATGGLETSLFGFLSVATVLLSLDARGTVRLMAVGLLSSLLVLTRPDGALFAGVALLAVAAPRPGSSWRASLSRASAAAAPLAVVVLAFVAWKLSYYGEWLPTAYYSKSASRPYWSQGAVYALLFLARNWFLAVALPAVAVLTLRDAFVLRARPRGLTREALVLLLAGLLFAAYVTRTGGDFMHARRLLPALPFLLLVLEDVVRAAFRPRSALGVAAVCAVAAAFPYPVFSDSEARISGVADERRFYPAAAIEARKLQGEVVGAALRGADARVMFGGGMLCFGYYSRLPYLVEMTGLTQYSLARLPIRQRGLIGHEKTADASWTTANRIHLVVLQAFPPISPGSGPLPLDEIDFGRTARARVWIYSDAVMDHLRTRPGVAFVPMEAVLERIRSGQDGRSPAEAARIASWLGRASLRPDNPLRRDVEKAREVLLRRATGLPPELP